MPYRSRGYRGMALRPIVTIKHVIDTNGSVTAAVQSVTDLVETKDTPSSFTNECETGSKTRAIYLRVEVSGSTPAGGVDNIYMYVFKNPGNRMILPSADAVGASDVKKYVIHQEMIMLSPFQTGAASFPRTLFKGVILVPRGYQRNGTEDRIQVVLQHRSGEVTQETNFCIESIYKEIR